jgi:hypothetical protein
MVPEKVEVVVVNEDWYSCFGTVPDGGEDKNMLVFSFTTEGDAVQLWFAIRDDACGWLRTCIFWTDEDAVKYVLGCLPPQLREQLEEEDAGSMPSEGRKALQGRRGEQQEEDPASLPFGLIVRERPAECRGGTPHSEKIEVFAVYGLEETVVEKVRDEGLDAAIRVYSFSTEEDVAEFLRGLELLWHWGKAICRLVKKAACPAQEELRGTPV